jgi:hypothetical protein
MRRKLRNFLKLVDSSGTDGSLLFSFIEARCCLEYGTRSTHERDQRCIQDFVAKILRRTNLKDLCVDGGIILELIFKKYGRKALTGLIWLRIGTGGGLL